MSKKITKVLEAPNKDKRTLSGIKKAIKTLLNKFTPKQAAKKIGISTQKFTSLQKQVKAGKKYNPELKELLNKKAGIKPPESKEQKAARQEFGLTRDEWEKQNRKIQREAKKELREKKKQKEQELGYEVSKKGIYIYENESIAKKYYTHRKEVKTMLPSKQQALNWIEKIGNVAEYFVIIKKKSKKTGADGWSVYDIRTPKERRARAKKNK